MINWTKMWQIVGLFLVCQILIWFQNYGQLKWLWLKENIWLPLFFSVPITYMFIKVTNFGYTAFNNQTWPVRFIGFSVGIIVFTLCSTFILNEAFTLKKAICLLLCLSIILIQMFWV